MHSLRLGTGFSKTINGVMHFSISAQLHKKKNQFTYLIRGKIYLGKKLCFANHENYSAISLVTNIPSLISNVKDHKTVRWWKEQ